MSCDVYTFVFFFLNDTATSEIYTYCLTLSLHDALPIWCWCCRWSGCWHEDHRLERARCGGLPRSVATADAAHCRQRARGRATHHRAGARRWRSRRSEEHTSELQSLMRISYAVFCLKKKQENTFTHNTSITTRRKI